MRRGDSAQGAFQAPVDVHASADGQVYMFRRTQNESAASSDDEENDVMEMRPRVCPAQDQDRLRNVELLERKVLDGDNLNKLALQYGCKVADIKRVNNLLQEQDLFALTSIKIPVQKHSFLTESHTDKKEEDGMPTSDAMSLKPQDRARAQAHLQEVTDFLMEVDNDLEKLIQTTSSDRNDEASDDFEKQQRSGVKGKALTGHGADWGIQWWNAVVAMLLIGIILPIFYIIYIKTKHNNNGLSPTAGIGASQSPVTSVNHSGLSTRGLQHFQEPG